jgi:hypothetical protein
MVDALFCEIVMVVGGVNELFLSIAVLQVVIVHLLDQKYSTWFRNSASRYSNPSMLSRQDSLQLLLFRFV